MDPDTRDLLLEAMHEIAIQRYDGYQRDTGDTNPSSWLAFRAGYQNCFIDILSGVFGREAVTP